MRSKKDLRPYQRAAVEFVKKKKRCALFVDPGLGKTIITLTALADLIDAIDCGKVLIVAPPQVAKKVWHTEILNWSHLKDKSFVVIKGTPKQRRDLMKRSVCFNIVSMELLPWLLEEIGGNVPKYSKILGGDLRDGKLNGKPVSPGNAVKTPSGDLYFIRKSGAVKLKDSVAERYEPGDRFRIKDSAWRGPETCPYSAIVVDESSKIKSSKTNRWLALKQLAFAAEYFIELTGTPSANSLEDLWSQMYLIDGGQRLGGTLTNFRDRWFRTSYSGFGYTAKSWALPSIKNKIEDVTFTLREEDYANLPPRLYNYVKLSLDDKTFDAYKTFAKTYVLKLSEQKSLLAKNGAAITTKLLQLSNGVVYDSERGEHEFHDIKLKALADIVEEIPGQPLLVVYAFKSDVRRIQKLHKNSVLFDGREKIVDAWNDGKIPMLLVHPLSVAHGLNLQFGGNNVVWYSPTHYSENYIQMNKRLHRSGQTKPVVIHHLLIENTIDEDVIAALEHKNNVQENLLNSLKKRINEYAS